MAKKNTSPASSNGTNGDGKIVLPTLIKLDASKIAAAKQYAAEHDAFNITVPETGKAYLVLIEGIDEVEVRNRESFIGRFRDLEVGDVKRFWLSAWLVKEFGDKQVQVNGLPILMTYQGRKNSKKSSNTFNAWARTYFTLDESVALGIIPRGVQVTGDAEAE